MPRSCWPAGRKRPGGSLFILALSLKDPVELWLEGIRFASDGFCVEVLDREIPLPDLSGINADHIMIWTDKVLDAGQQALYQRWLSSGLPVFLAGCEAARAQKDVAIKGQCSSTGSASLLDSLSH
ncbi:Uncharacterised protein [Cedecea neteri]|uniref:Transcriptional regulator MlrA-like C-terminal domain-containing protein n=1 Tax=Cedecea neteri TaxID=158822 RepID=A0A2X3JBQ4_9ENTR|nr:Uncharacterised protein [Cedecea neteri]